MQNNSTEYPTKDTFLRPLLEQAKVSPISRKTTVPSLLDKLNLPDEIRNLKLKSGQNQMANRASWAMTLLVKAKFIEKHSTEKFTYQITTAGREYLRQHQGAITSQDLCKVDGYQEAWKAASEKNRQNRQNKQLVEPSPTIGNSTPDALIDDATSELDENLRTDLLENLLNTNPYHFEQIVIDVLVAMGYGGSREEASQVTQRSNDGGIDGIINEDRLGLDVIYVQAKRYKNPVGRVDVQNFVGALAGKKAHKGIFITTSNYNSNAIEFAATVQQKIILIDGHRLADLMIACNVGVSTERTIEIKRLNTDYFENN